MKTLYLIRHAKSSWEFDLDDRERPLNERGLHDAPSVARATKVDLVRPQLILSSDAVRAKTTAVLYLKELGISDSELILNARLYDFEGGQVEKIIRATADTVDVLMIFGHNNAMTYLVNKLGNLEIDNVATASFTEISFDGDAWTAIKNGNTKRHIRPNDLL